MDGGPAVQLASYLVTPSTHPRLPSPYVSGRASKATEKKTKRREMDASLRRKTITPHATTPQSSSSSSPSMFCALLEDCFEGCHHTQMMRPRQATAAHLPSRGFY